MRTYCEGHKILRIQDRLLRLPYGRSIFSFLIARIAPYNATISPIIMSLKPGYMQTIMKNRRKVQNHLRAIHATAMCTLCEYTAGICMECSIPQSKRWIPIGLEISYQKIGKTDLIATCNLEAIDFENHEQLDCKVVITNTFNEIVAEANVQMKLSNRF